MVVEATVQRFSPHSFTTTDAHQWAIGDSGATQGILRFGNINGLTGVVTVSWDGGSTYENVVCQDDDGNTYAEGTTITTTDYMRLYFSIEGATHVQFTPGAVTSASPCTFIATLFAFGSPAGAISTAPASLSYTCLGVSYNVSVSSSAQVFSGAPAGVKEVWFTLETAGIRLRSDGSAATSTTGLPFAAGTVAPHKLTKNQTALLLMRAIGNGGTAVMNIEYWG